MPLGRGTRRDTTYTIPCSVTPSFTCDMGRGGVASVPGEGLVDVGLTRLYGSPSS